MDAISYANLSVGSDLRKMRQKAGLLQTDVARMAKIAPAMLCRVESGNGNPTIGTITKIVRAIETLSKREA